MKHVLVETNWVVAYAAPAHSQVRAAADLAAKAHRGELQLHIPAVCLAEARHPIRTRFNPRVPADSLRAFLDWASVNHGVTLDERETVRRVIDQYESSVTNHFQRLEQILSSLRAHTGVEVFPLSDPMLERAAELSTRGLDLKPFDQAILAAVLVRAEELRE